MPTVLIIDDQSTSRMILEQLVYTLEQGTEVVCFEDPVKALDWAKKNTHDLILTDYKMPNMDGAEFTQWLRKIPTCSDVPVVIVTGVEDKEVRYRSLEAGATDFLTKPIDHAECRARCRNLLTLRRQQRIIKDRAVWLEREIERTTRSIEMREKETLLRLARAGEYRDEATGNHVVRMARYALLMAAELGLPEKECEILEQAAPMHDIGKIGIPDDILRKHGRLTPAETAVMRTHTTIGYEILRDSPSCFLQTGAVIALSHHERFDGGGYPQGLAGNDIPLPARIVAVADVYDALVSNRPYKFAWSHEKALDFLRAGRGRQFDPHCVDAIMDRKTAVEAIQRDLSDRPGQRIKPRELPLQTDRDIYDSVKI